MTIIKAEVRPYGFAPFTGWDDDQKRKFPIGSAVHLSIVKGRSPRMERFYWALIDKVAGACGYERYPLSDELLIRTKRVNRLSFISGTLSFSPKRISDMKHDEFKEYVDAAIDLICVEYLGEMSRQDLLREVEQMLKITYAEAFAPERKSKEEKQNAVRQ